MRHIKVRGVNLWHFFVNCQYADGICDNVTLYEVLLSLYIALDAWFGGNPVIARGIIRVGPYTDMATMTRCWGEQQRKLKYQQENNI